MCLEPYTLHHMHPFVPQAMDAILNGRAEYATILADLGFLTGDYVQHIRQVCVVGRSVST